MRHRWRRGLHAERHARLSGGGAGYRWGHSVTLLRLHTRRHTLGRRLTLKLLAGLRHMRLRRVLRALHGRRLHALKLRQRHTRLGLEWGLHPHRRRLLALLLHALLLHARWHAWCGSVKR